jgi:hypothetical protein
MGAISENTTITYKTAATKNATIPVVAATRIFKGAFAGRHFCTGLLKPFVVGDIFTGIVVDEADNSDGAASAIDGTVALDGVIELSLTGAAATDIGDPVFATDSGAIDRFGHTLAYMGRITGYSETGRVEVTLKQPGELPRRGEKGCQYVEAGGPPATTTGAAAATSMYVDGMTYSSALGLGISHEAADGKHMWTMELDATNEVSNAQFITPAMFNPGGGIVFETDLTVESASGATIDVDWGIANAVVVTAFDGAFKAIFHYDGGAETLLAGSDDNTVDVAEVDTTKLNVSGTTKKFTVILRPTGAPEFYINRAQVLTANFAAVVLLQACTTPYIAFVNLEKTIDTTTSVVKVTRFVCYGAGSA